MEEPWRWLGIAPGPDTVLPLLKSADFSTRYHAAEWLAKNPSAQSPAAIALLREFLADPNPSFRIIGAEALLKLGAGEGVPDVLIELVTHDPAGASYIALRAAAALISLGQVEYYEVLRNTVFFSKLLETRGVALGLIHQVLPSVVSTAVVDLADLALNDTDTEMRRNALLILMRLPPSLELARIVYLCAKSESNVYTKKMAVEYLENN